MKKIKIANCCGTLGKGYQRLAKDTSLLYQENSPADNITRLMAGEVDVALISVADFALHGGCLGLDFGVDLVKSAAQITLYHKASLQKLQTIYLIDSVGAVGLFLKLLMEDHWQIVPRIVRIIRPIMLADLKDDEGLVCLGDQEAVSGEYNAEDLTTHWKEWSGLPLLALIWATRQAAITSETHKVLDAALKKCTKEDKEPSCEGACCLTPRVKEDLNKFYELCATKDLLPQATYVSISKVIRGVAPNDEKHQCVSDILQDTLDGKRLSIEDACKVVQEAPLADLALAADLLRSRLFSKRSIGYDFSVRFTNLENLLAESEVLSKKTVNDVSTLIFYPFSEQTTDLEIYEEALRRLKSVCKTSLEGIGIPVIFNLAQAAALTFEEVASRLVEAGLDAVPAWGGEMLIKKRGKRSAKNTPDWLRVVKWMHRFGAKASCCMRIAKWDSWEVRLLHLHKLRSLQDLNTGFSHFSLVPDLEWQGSELFETYLRGTAMARLFLDNIASLHANVVDARDPLAPLALSCGANELRIDTTLRSDVTESLLNLL